MKNTTSSSTSAPRPAVIYLCPKNEQQNRNWERVRHAACENIPLLKEAYQKGCLGLPDRDLIPELLSGLLEERQNNIHIICDKEDAESLLKHLRETLSIEAKVFWHAYLPLTRHKIENDEQLAQVLQQLSMEFVAKSSREALFDEDGADEVPLSEMDTQAAEEFWNQVAKDHRHREDRIREYLNSSNSQAISAHQYSLKDISKKSQSAVAMHAKGEAHPWRYGKCTYVPAYGHWGIEWYSSMEKPLAANGGGPALRFQYQSGQHAFAVELIAEEGQWVLAGQLEESEPLFIQSSEHDNKTSFWVSDAKLFESYLYSQDSSRASWVLMKLT